MKGLYVKVRSNTKLLAIIVIAIMLMATMGAASMLLEPDEKKDEYVLRADIETDQMVVKVYDEVTFSANGSEGEIVSYLWDFGEGDVVRGVTATREFPESRYYNIYLTVTDSKGDQDISKVNITVLNYDEETSTTGPVLDSTARRGPSYDYAYLVIYGGVTRPTVYVNWTADTECAMISINAWLPVDSYSETVVCAGDGLEVRLVYEDIELEMGDDYWIDISIECMRGYVANYVMEIAVVY